ncbi:hypothetical protein CO609_02795 [Lysobacteraceae bacterium NML91-0268]|nr:hypothetical protein CO609_02795 [Xanthomonadaceae bacterium NML91-0268]
MNERSACFSVVFEFFKAFKSAVSACLEFTQNRLKPATEGRISHRAQRPSPCCKHKNMPKM